MPARIERLKVYTGKSLRKRTAFTIAELLIALAITGLLLAAVAVAFNASVINYNENEDIFKAVNSARQALYRMTSQLRTAGYYDSNSEVWLGVNQASPSHQCEFYDPDGEHIIYEYCDSNDAMYEYRDSNDPNRPPPTLCEHVTAASFTKIPADGDPSDAKSVLISLTVQAGDSEQTLSAAAVVRRSLD